MASPYDSLPVSSFWRSAVAEPTNGFPDSIWKPKHKIDKSTLITCYGSCFAQHFGRALQMRGYSRIMCETRPEVISDQTAKRFNYGIYPSRTGNIYTTTMLLQWVHWAYELSEVPDEVWESGGRIYDPFRPKIEPNGFASISEMLLSRAAALKAFRQSIKHCDLFVFTLGLTERWINKHQQYEYPLCPGTAAGQFSNSEHQFDNLGFQAVKKSLLEAIKIIKDNNPRVKFLLTVSPVPLTATMAPRHILSASSYSKSVLRSVAGELSERKGFVDYFPSYEIVTTPFSGKQFFMPNMRSVTSAGVSLVMDEFFGSLESCNTSSSSFKASDGQHETVMELTETDNLICEEQILDAFSEKNEEDCSNW